MTSELVAIFDYYEKEKGIERQVMIDALQSALESAARRSIGPARGLNVTINPDDGQIKTFAKLIAVEKVSKPYEEIKLETAKKINQDIQIGEEVDVEITPKGFGRIAAQTAKQVMMQNLKKAEQEVMYKEFKDRAGEIVNGIVKGFDGADVYIDLGKFEAVMPEKERVPNEDYNIGDRIRAYIVNVGNYNRGPEIILSRSHPNFVRRLFEIEVSEITEGTVEIRSLARDAGYRTKIAVISSYDKIDPVGACVGLRGSRVKNIVRELNNEKIDIIRWSDNIEDFVTDSMKPSKIEAIKKDEDEHVIYVTVDEKDLSKAIGRKGQNVRLTSKLIGWDLKITKDESVSEIFEQRVERATKDLIKKLNIKDEYAKNLVTSGINSVDVLMETSPDDISDILDITLKEAINIKDKAKGLVKN